MIFSAVFTNNDNTEAADDTDEDDGGFADHPEPEVDADGNVVRNPRLTQSNSIESGRGRAAINSLGQNQGRLVGGREQSSRRASEDEEEQEESM